MYFLCGQTLSLQTSFSLAAMENRARTIKLSLQCILKLRKINPGSHTGPGLQPNTRVNRNQLFTSTSETLSYLAVSAKFLSSFHWIRWVIYLALTLATPLIKYTGPALCSVNSRKLHVSSWCLCLSLICTRSKGLEAFGDAKSLLHILCLLSSLHSAVVRKVVGDGPEEMGVERLLLTEAQFALLLLLFLPFSFISSSSGWLPSTSPLLAERFNPMFPTYFPCRS